MIFEFEEFGFKFGTYAAAETQAISGLPIGSLFEKMNNEADATLCLIYYFYGAAKAYNVSRGIKKEVTLDSVGDLLEKIGFEKALQILQESLQMPKNSEAPKETGQS